MFVPTVCIKAKIENMIRFGKEFIEIKTVGDNFEESVHEAILYSKENNMTFLHPFGDIDLITGYATMAVEII